MDERNNGQLPRFHGLLRRIHRVFAVIFIVYLVSGVVPLIRAAMLRAHLQVETTWGTLIIIFLAFSFLGMGGFFIEPY